MEPPKLEAAPQPELNIGEKLLQLFGGSQALNDYMDREAKRRLGFAAQPAVTDPMNSPIPGANPEAPTGHDALIGALLAIGGAGLPQGVSRAGAPQLSRPGSRPRPGGMTIQEENYLADTAAAQRGEDRLGRGMGMVPTRKPVITIQEANKILEGLK